MLTEARAIYLRKRSRSLKRWRQRLLLRLPNLRTAESRSRHRRKRNCARGYEEEFTEEDLADARDPASFVSFMMSIASNAASALGMMEHPVTHQREVDVELGKHWIDVLGMLQKKTAGQLDASGEADARRVCSPICGCNTSRWSTRRSKREAIYGQ